MKEKINALLSALIEQEESNRLEGLDGTAVSIYEAPLVGYADAADPRFRGLRHPGIVGEHAALPTDFMPEARTVAAIFFPFSEEVRRSNREGDDPSLLWLRASDRGKTVIRVVCDQLIAALEKDGVKAVEPTRQPAFQAVIGDKAVGSDVSGDPLWADKHYTCNWSERHVAFLCGLGTFGISGGFITAKGSAGTLLTLILDREVEIAQGGCGDPYGNCTRCGACARRCPAKAIDPENGYSPEACLAREHEIMEKFAPLRGCGKCRVGVPCEYKNPAVK